MKRKGYKIKLSTNGLGQAVYVVKRLDGAFVAHGSAGSDREAAAFADRAVQRDRAKQKLLPTAEVQP